MTGIGYRLLPIEKVDCCSVLTGTARYRTSRTRYAMKYAMMYAKMYAMMYATMYVKVMVSNQRELCDARWWSVVRRTVKCGDNSRYAFC
ncbi:hypothetical protein TIFTF001_042103 [Ficus carica]|uniref:Uncharacterized protein n=1 Tax=Ficus carica TaxID=3494 RepID=A0AA87ZWE1_FICCA|nr:hypothetical protein TIFTF001_042103 [Ficus carica]